MGDMSRIEPLPAAAASTPEPRPVTDPPVSQRMPRGRLLKRAALALGLLAGTAMAGHFGYDYWTTGQYLVATDDAYVKADYTAIAPKVSGYIAAVLVDDNQPVRAGQPLARPAPVLRAPRARR